MAALGQLRHLIHRKLKNIRARRFHRQFIRPGDLVFDIGANVGDRSEQYLSLGAKVVAVEPQTSCIKILFDRFSDSKSMTLIQKAVSESNGSAEMFISSISEISTLSPDFIAAYQNQPGVSWENKETVRLCTLSELVREFGIPKYIKIDVEGYERKVLETLDVPVSYLSFEYNRPLKKEAIACVELLQAKASYRFNFIVYEDMTLYLREWLSPSSFLDFLNDVDDSILTGEIFASLEGV